MAEWFWLQPLATIVGSAIAVTAAWLVGVKQVAIAGKMSDTATLSLKEKIFERRLKAFIEIMEEIKEISTEAPDLSMIPRPKKTLWQERFLFTPDVFRQIATGYDYAEAVRVAESTWARCQNRGFTDENLQELRNKANRAHHILERHVDQLADMAMPDMALFTSAMI